MANNLKVTLRFPKIDVVIEGLRDYMLWEIEREVKM